jgi:hypothetical protein
MSANEQQIQTLPAVLQHWSTLPTAESDPPCTTIDISDRAGRVELQNVLAGETKKLNDQPAGMCLSIRNLVVHYACAPDDETGEEKAGRILTLVCDEGLFYTMSEWAYRDLQRAAAVDPWDPAAEALMVEVVHPRCTNGHIRLGLRVI